MKLTPINRTTLGEQVASQLAGMISARKWKPGDKLPSEFELRKTLNIGRSTLREALRSLSYVGLVVIKPGEGTFVSHGPGKPIHEVFAQGIIRSREDVNDLFETRVVLETELAALCSQRASEADLEELESHILAMEKNKDHRAVDFASLDTKFHLAIAQGAKNRMLGRMFQSIQGLIKEILTMREYILGGHDETCVSHRKILVALKQRDATAARTAMHEHLCGFAANYLREYLANSSLDDKAEAAKKETLPPLQASRSDTEDPVIVGA
jgi:GntR family transcriptional repressor for pyruvate dehydrogenase complex